MSLRISVFAGKYLLAVVVLRQDIVPLSAAARHIDVIYPRRLVDDVEALDSRRVSFGYLAEALFDVFFEFAVRHCRYPPGDELVPEEGMTLHADAVLFTEIRDDVGGRTAVDVVRGVGGVAQVSAGRFGALPVERDGGGIEELREFLLVHFVALVLVLVEHEDVRAEVEVDVGHPRLDRDVAGDGLSAVGYDEPEESLAAALDVGVDAVPDVALARADEVVYLFFHI